jgi:hypothetical protein
MVYFAMSSVDNYGKNQIRGLDKYEDDVDNNLQGKGQSGSYQLFIILKPW